MEDEKKKVTIAALMTAPRYESVFARNYIEIALKKWNIPLNISQGVYYGQCMQVMLEQQVENGIDFALTVDFDSMFTARHVERLLAYIAGDEKIDAIAAVQPKRGCGDLLAANSDGATSIEWDGNPVKVDTAYFGLTVIDLNKLKDIPKPWFLPIPNEDGRWDGGKIDDDVYFWKCWHEAGNSVYIDPGCRLGHLEELITVFDPEMNIEHLYPKDWVENNASTVD